MVNALPSVTSLRGGIRSEAEKADEAIRSLSSDNKGLLRRPSGTPRNDMDDVRMVLATVMDPEIPTLSVIDLGMITGVTMSDDGIHVRLLPTFVACPATSYIRKSITDTLAKGGFPNVTVDMEDELSWSSDRVTERGRKLLEAFGLGAPIQIDGVLNLETIEHVNCPHCGSANTTLRSMFGSTLCRSIHYCEDCRQGFERFKPL